MELERKHYERLVNRKKKQHEKYLELKMEEENAKPLYSINEIQEDVTYDKYLKSRNWSQRRRQYFENHPQQCFVCHSTESLELHHNSYINIGRENDNDLCLLCRTHHDTAHQKVKEGECKLLEVHEYLRNIFLGMPTKVKIYLANHNH